MKPLKAFHEAGGRYVLLRETTPGVFDSIAENMAKADAERIVALEAHCTRLLSLLESSRIPGEITQTPEAVAGLRKTLEA